MPDPRFFKLETFFSLGELAEISGASLARNSDPRLVLESVAPLDQATQTDISFFDNVRYKGQFLKTKAGACVVSPAFEVDAPENVHLLLCDNPYKAYALIAQAFYPEAIVSGEISKRAHISSSAKIGDKTSVQAGAVIGDGVEIGQGCFVGANAVIAQNVVIGDCCHIGTGTSISHALIGDYVRVYPGARIGQDGFGFAIDPVGHVKVPQLGRVLIEDHVEIGANTTIDRGAGPDTIIGQGTWIDNLVQIGHNVRIGRGCVIVAQVGISGSTVVEDYVVIGGQVGVAGHLRIGVGAKIGAQSGVMRNVPAGEEQIGSPAISSLQFMRQVATLNRLTKNKKKA